MTKLSQVNQKNSAQSDSVSNNISTSNDVTKVKKRTRRSFPRDSPPQRSSIYRGVTRHRWTGRFEAHLWDKNCWNESQNKKGRQVYLGAYDDEESAAHAYDLAALKYWGQDTILNFPVSTYQKELKEMENQSREEYIGSLRRKSSGFSRGVSKYRGVARHHHNGRWEARIGRVFGNKYLYLGTYATQEEAATAYDMAAIEYRGLNAVTNFDLSRYIKWLKPNQTNPTTPNSNIDTTTASKLANPSHHQQHNPGFFTTTDDDNRQPQGTGVGIPSETLLTQPRPGNATSALGLLLQSSKFKEMMEMTSAVVVDQCQFTPPPSTTSEPTRYSFPENVETYLECQDSSSLADEDRDIIFGELNSFMAPMFSCDIDA
ncbi:hypothetical protein ES319_A05G009200v1 [Gossypium barbadense]|uniref:AP2/ERF domain-containing protein n=2 Tax=Gossypium TaxID=3633 RepID=A0A5J5VI41_GOSBA|nr:hypothetical protein ES319_A05G009200v1 [Gossypium barbadense]TYH15000.1 hypothetical protein ES288_A05G009400v1 [Gossypium darwinii]